MRKYQSSADKIHVIQAALSCVPEVKNITKNKDCYVVCGINNKE